MWNEWPSNRRHTYTSAHIKTNFKMSEYKYWWHEWWHMSGMHRGPFKPSKVIVTKLKYTQRPRDDKRWMTAAKFIFKKNLSFCSICYHFARIENVKKSNMPFIFNLFPTRINWILFPDNPSNKVKWCENRHRVLCVYSWQSWHKNAQPLPSHTMPAFDVNATLI